MCLFYTCVKTKNKKAYFEFFCYYFSNSYFSLLLSVTFQIIPLILEHQKLLALGRKLNIDGKEMQQIRKTLE
jgi:hypothetical protein